MSAVAQVKTASLVERIADAVLYEGYILYPYRPSSVKNQQRWNFGALCPIAYAHAQHGTENASMQTQCLVAGDANSAFKIKIRFLHLSQREVAEVVSCDEALEVCGHLKAEGTDHFRLVPSLDCNGKVLQAWQEAVERSVSITELGLSELQLGRKTLDFSFPATRSFELVTSAGRERVAGLIIRTQEEVRGVVNVSLSELGPLSEKKLFRLQVEIRNETPFADAGLRTRDDALLRSLVSTHTILNVSDGQFLSLLEPPEFAEAAARTCSNINTYPVLVGEQGECDCILSSPIILYDYPQIAPESAGDLCDGTEIDEILTLRIMTLTEEEKQEVRSADDRARAILERTENLPAEQLMKLHGVMKSVKGS